mgnify:CR=1 FL=1
MDEKILKLLYDIDIAIKEIDIFFEQNPSDFSQYRSNIILKRATERELEIIGEAVNRILKIDPDFPLKNARNIIGLRNQVIHAYDTISDENIWGYNIQTLNSFKDGNSRVN